VGWRNERGKTGFGAEKKTPKKRVTLRVKVEKRPGQVLVWLTKGWESKMPSRATNTLKEVALEP